MLNHTARSGPATMELGTAPLVGGVGKGYSVQDGVWERSIVATEKSSIMAMPIRKVWLDAEALLRTLLERIIFDSCYANEKLIYCAGNEFRLYLSIDRCP